MMMMMNAPTRKYAGPVYGGTSPSVIHINRVSSPSSSYLPFPKATCLRTYTAARQHPQRRRTTPTRSVGR